MNTRLDYLWEKVSLFTQFSDLAKIFEPIFFKISLKTGPIFDHPLLVKIGSEIRKSVQNRKTDIFSSPGVYHIWAWWPSWSTDHDHLSNLSFSHPKEAPYEI